MTIQPLQDYVVLEELAPSDVTNSGIIVPTDIQSVNSTQQAKVVSHGADIKLPIKVGDTVLFKHHAFDDIEVGKQTFKIGREDGIYGLLV